MEKRLMLFGVGWTWVAVGSGTIQGLLFDPWLPHRLEAGIITTILGAVMLIIWFNLVKSDAKEAPKPTKCDCGSNRIQEDAPHPFCLDCGGWA